MEMFHRGMQAETALEFLSDFFPNYKEKAIRELLKCKVEDMPIKRAVIEEISKIETQMKQHVISAQNIIQEVGETYEESRKG